jgi:murein DD-endopeptidase MepM/ murein hydrolase activator NlpD
MAHLVTPAVNGRPRDRRRDVWPLVAFGLAGVGVVLRAVPELRPGALGVVCWELGREVMPWVAWVGLSFGAGWSLARRPFWTRRRAAGFALLLGLAFSAGWYRVYPSSHDGAPSRVAFRLPLDGPVTVGWGGATPAVNYHVEAPDQRWAYDLLVTRDGSTHKGDGSLLTDYYTYNLPVLAPAAGEVVEAFDGDPDMPLSTLGGGTTPSGNHVLIRVAPREYVLLAHLRPGSVSVRPGDRVAEGQPIGRVGNSGNTSEPHLHVHLQDAADDAFAEGIPMPFHHVKTPDGKFIDRVIPVGGVEHDRWTGQVVENVPPDAPPEKGGGPG